MPRKPVTRSKPNIQSQEVLSETARRSYEMLRLTRVRYEGNPHTFLDLRLFQRDYGDDEKGGSYHPTRKGVQVKEEQFQRLIGGWTLVPCLIFHPSIYKKAYPALQREEFDTAVFCAFKEVEVRVRRLSGAPADMVGTALMRRAFDAKRGTLTDTRLPTAEREGLAHLFAGAISCYKNPSTHRDIEMTFNDAFGMLLVASHLLQVLDRITARLQAGEGAGLLSDVLPTKRRKAGRG